MAFTCALRIDSIVMCIRIYVCRFVIPYKPCLNKLIVFLILIQNFITTEISQRFFCRVV